MVRTHHTFEAAFDDIIEQYKGRIDRLRDELLDMMEEIAAEGGSLMIEILESAVTPTGAARALTGGAPGRVETGTMRDAIEHRSDRDGDLIVAEWGWLESVEAYFLFQEHGAEVFGVQFEGMKALWGSYLQMREKLAELLGAE